MPLDADPVDAFAAAGTVFVLRERESSEGPLAVAAWGLAGAEDHYVSHFSTCPSADIHRVGGRRFGKTEQLRQVEQRSSTAGPSPDSEQASGGRMGTDQGGEGDGRDDGREKPHRPTQLRDLPGKTFEDIFKDEPPQDRMELR